MKQRIVIEIRGGTFVGCYASDPNIQACLVDWDEIAASHLTAGTPTRPDPLEAMPADTREMVAGARSGAIAGIRKDFPALQD